MNYVEIAKGSPANRGILIPVNNLIKHISKEPLYRSVYLYDDNALEYVNEQYRSLYKFKQGSVEDIRRRLQAKKELQEEEATREDLGTGAVSSTSTMPTGAGGY